MVFVEGPGLLHGEPMSSSWQFLSVVSPLDGVLVKGGFIFSEMFRKKDPDQPYCGFILEKVGLHFFQNPEKGGGTPGHLSFSQVFYHVCLTNQVGVRWVPHSRGYHQR